MHASCLTKGCSNDNRARERCEIQNNFVPWELSERRVHRRHRSVSLRSCQSASPNAARIRKGFGRRDAQIDCVGWVYGFVQGACSVMGTSDSLHDDEVCDVRENSGGTLQVRGAGAEI